VRVPANPDRPDAAAKRPRAVRWSDLRLRVLSASVLAPLALACLWIGGAAWVALVAVAGIGLAVEWAQLCGVPAAGVGGLSVPCTVCLAAAAAAAQGGAGLWLLAVGAVAVRFAAGKPVVASGVWYVGLGTVALIWLRADASAGRANVLFLMLVVWASDIGAYMVGRLVGGPRLAPAISPGKTVSGAAGGLLAAMAVGWGAARLLDPSGAAPLAVLAVAAALGVVSQAGDLLESAIKRHFGVKDSGRLIPGHGGLLDRLDGVLTAAPAAALLALYVGRGVVLWR
jgi:phosphatidate cytidylyltransferase